MIRKDGEGEMKAEKVKKRFSVRLRITACLLGLLFVPLLSGPQFAEALTLNVLGVNKDGSMTPILDYRWVVEEDLTYHVPFDLNGSPLRDPDTLSVGFHRSYMPVIAQGTSADLSVLANLDPAGHYFVSVLPMASGTYSIGGGPVKPGDGELSVYLNQLRIPTAQISVFVFHDNHPINNAPDLPAEVGLEGFSIILEDAGGRYGMSAGAQMMDAFGNMLGTTYARDVNGEIIFEADGSPRVESLGNGMILTDAQGRATIKNLAPGKYGVQAVPPAGQGWTQTSTIEGTQVIDAWVKANEPPYFQEFGPPGWHVFIGFLQPTNNTDILTGGSTISGQVVNLHLSRPPDYAFNAGAPIAHVTPWVGLNMGTLGQGEGIYAMPCAEDGSFSIPNVPPGDYQLVVWDDAQDIIFAFHALTVPAGGDPLELGKVPVFQWFTRLEHYVFSDDGGGTPANAENGFWDPGEKGVPEQAVNLRWRDGTMYQSMPTDVDGFVPFDEIFPFFAWLVAEVDFLRFKATGVTITVDAGGPIDPADPWTFGGQLNPQLQDPAETDPMNYSADPRYRTERGPVLTQAFQGFLGQTSVMQWGKAAYGPGPDLAYGTPDDENGGISGVVYYSTTRAEDDPRYGAPEPWEPGIPRVQVTLYQDIDCNGAIDDIDGQAGIQLADIDNYPFGWSEGGLKGPEDVERSGNDGVFDLGDALEATTTDSWDDNQPTGCRGEPFLFMGEEKDCYDGLRNFNQVRPGVFDGGYAFGSAAGGVLAAGGYIVEAFPPPGYEIVKEEDKNVDFGDEYVPSDLLLPPVCVNYDDNGGLGHLVPPYLSLFADQEIETAFGGQYRPVCDRKQVRLYPGQNTAADFFLFTETPVAGHIYGFILDDTQNEFDPTSPTFGEKYAPPWLPASIRDWTGREISRVYSDQYGVYNALVPSTYTANLPEPSGMSPNMLTVCLNDPAIPVPGKPGQYTLDPRFNRQYSQYCYTFQYMPGATTYLDTPVLPVAAFAGPDQYPLDCEFVDGTPKIYTASVTATGGGPYVTAAGQEIQIVSEGPEAWVPNPAYDGIDGVEPKLVPRDYGFGAIAGEVTIGGVALAVQQGNWSQDLIVATVPAGVSTGELVVTRGDNGLSSVVGVTVTVRAATDNYNVLRVPAGGSIQATIDNLAQPNDLVLVPPGNYEEMVILWKPVKLQSWGAGSTTINAIKTPAEKLVLWRQKVTDLIESGAVDLLPSQEVGQDFQEPITLFSEEGCAVLVLALNADPQQGGFGLMDGHPNARIDGFTITGADHAGGVVVNGYAHYLEISNNRIINNNGFFGGGIRLGHPILTAETEQGLTYENAQNDHVFMHNNHITQNSGLGGYGGGVSVCTGSDGYVIADNYICGNIGLGGGGGIGHIGLSNHGAISSNRILFNESFNQSLTVSGGGILIAGAPALGGPGSLSPGAGSVSILDNVIKGNAAGAGDGGGIAVIRLNGEDVERNPNANALWYVLNVFNNFVVDNVAGLAGGGISLEDSPNVRIIQNTIAHNDSVGTAALAFVPGVPNESQRQPAGVVGRAHTAELEAAIGNVIWLQGFRGYSNPQLIGNIILRNRSFNFYIDPNVTGPGRYGLSPKVDDVNNEPPDFRDLGVLGMPAPAFLNPRNCLLTSTAGYHGSNVEASSASPFMDGYFNGDRGLTVTMPEPTTAIQPAVAFDEGGNYIRVRFSPLTPVGDYHITADSEARDGLRNLMGFLQPELRTDIDGDPRPAFSIADIGADEVASGAAGQAINGLRR